MKLYDFAEVLDPAFAVLEIEGTWDTSKRCPGCMRPTGRVRPLQLSWRSGKGPIGDFTAVTFGANDMAVTATTAAALKREFRGFMLGRVEFVPGRRSARRAQELAAQITALRDLWVTSVVDFDPARSTIDHTGDCARCGLPLYRIHGTEERTLYRMNERTGRITWRIKPRPRGQGIFIRRRALGGADIFRIRHMNGTLCTQRVKELVEDHGFTNVAFREIGETF